MAQMSTSSNRWYQLTSTEIIALLLIVGILIMLLWPSPQWVADGQTELSVHVFVFDAEIGIPIEGAQVGVVREPGIFTMEDTKSIQRRWPRRDDLATFLTHQTDANGIATIQHTFHHGSSNKNPVTRAHTANAWVLVTTENHGAITMPVSAAEQEVALIRERGGVMVPVGLLKHSP